MKKKAKEALRLLSALKYCRFLCFKRLTSEIQPLFHYHRGDQGDEGDK